MRHAVTVGVLLCGVGFLAIAIVIAAVPRHRRTLKVEAGAALAAARRVLPGTPDAEPVAASAVTPSSTSSAPHRPARSRPAIKANSRSVTGKRTAPAAPPAAVAAAVFQPPRWGTSGDGANDMPDGATRGLARRPRGSSVVVTSAELCGRVYSESLVFGRSGLLRVVELRPAAIPSDVQALFDEVATWLTAQNGEPSERTQVASEAGSWRRFASWVAQGNRIELQAWETQVQDAPVLQLDLSTGQARAANARGLVLTYEPNPLLARASP